MSRSGIVSGVNHGLVPIQNNPSSHVQLTDSATRITDVEQRTRSLSQNWGDHKKAVLLKVEVNQDVFEQVTSFQNTLRELLALQPELVKDKLSSLREELNGDLPIPKDVCKKFKYVLDKILKLKAQKDENFLKHSEDLINGIKPWVELHRKFIDVEKLRSDTLYLSWSELADEAKKSNNSEIKKLLEDPKIPDLLKLENDYDPQMTSVLRNVYRFGEEEAKKISKFATAVRGMNQSNIPDNIKPGFLAKLKSFCVRFLQHFKKGNGLKQELEKEGVVAIFNELREGLLSQKKDLQAFIFWNRSNEALLKGLAYVFGLGEQHASAFSLNNFITVEIFNTKVAGMFQNDKRDQLNLQEDFPVLSQIKSTADALQKSMNQPIPESEELNNAREALKQALSMYNVNNEVRLLAKELDGYISHWENERQIWQPEI